MKTPNYDNKVGILPIPHVKGIAKDENAKDGDKKDNSAKKDSKNEKE